MRETLHLANSGGWPFTRTKPRRLYSYYSDVFGRTCDAALGCNDSVPSIDCCTSGRWYVCLNHTHMLYILHQIRPCACWSKCTWVRVCIFVPSDFSCLHRAALPTTVLLHAMEVTTLCCIMTNSVRRRTGSCPFALRRGPKILCCVEISTRQRRPTHCRN